jgi:hypothetical protein
MRLAKNKTRIDILLYEIREKRDSLLNFSSVVSRKCGAQKQVSLSAKMSKGDFCMTPCRGGGGGGVKGRRGIECRREEGHRGSRGP